MSFVGGMAAERKKKEKCGLGVLLLLKELR